MKNLIWISFFLLASCASSLEREIQKTQTRCGAIKTSAAWNYCITPGKGTSANEILYYFHGGGGSEKDWLDKKNYSGLIRKDWETQINHPTVVSISFGQMWFLIPKSKRSKSGLYEVFMKEVLPYVETKLLPEPPVRRQLLGESMGGTNAALLALRHPKLFPRVSLVCAGLDISTAGLKENQAKMIRRVRALYFPSENEARSNSPVSLMAAATSETLAGQSYFVSCGQQDDYGFFIGSQKFVNLATARNINIEWYPVPGRHCSLDIGALSSFLLNEPLQTKEPDA